LKVVVQMDIGLFAAFWVVSFSLVLTPGPDWAYAISSGLRERTLVPAISGILLGYLAITIVVAAGLGALVASIPVALKALTLIGVAYLLWFGVGVIRSAPVVSTGCEQAETWAGWFIRGFGVSGINPKALLLFLALLPQFTSQSASWPIAGQIAVMGIVHMGNCALVYSFVGVCSKIVLSTRPQIARRVTQISGIAMIVIALFLLFEQMPM
jgi:threonine/homoserine/homoserine lactone efflux protein